MGSYFGLWDPPWAYGILIGVMGSYLGLRDSNWGYGMIRNLPPCSFHSCKNDLENSVIARSGPCLNATSSSEVGPASLHSKRSEAKAPFTEEKEFPSHRRVLVCKSCHYVPRPDVHVEFLEDVEELRDLVPERLLGLTSRQDGHEIMKEAAACTWVRCAWYLSTVHVPSSIATHRETSS